MIKRLLLNVHSTSFRLQSSLRCLDALLSLCLKTSSQLLLAYGTVKAEMHSNFPATLLNKDVALKTHEMP